MSAIDPGLAGYLQSLKQTGVHLGLERMRGFVADLGNPQDSLPVIHIAGTNGKGSVAAMVEAIFRSAGWRTGLYTSPHLIRLGERIQVNRRPLANEELATHVDALRRIVDARAAAHGPAARPTYFEFMTALALRHFAQRRCDVAIIETGMGGRLDATNVVAPEVSAITSIGLDHCEFLGPTVEAIAAEKAGIIKAERPVVIGRLPAAAERVIRMVAAERGARVFSVTESFGDDLSQYPATNLEGAYQRVNAATAALLARQVETRWRFSDAVIGAALRHVDWPARWQRLRVGRREVILDGSHNAEGAEALDRELAALTGAGGPAPIIVVGVLGTARAKPLLETVCRHARELRLVVPAQSRACGYEELEALVPATFGGRVVRDRVDAMFPRAEACLPEVPPHIPVVVTGSLYLAGEVLVRLDPARGPFEPELQDF